jgi:hypothetical protein
MDNTQFVSIEYMSKIVEDYIYQRKKVRVRIILNNPMSIRKDVVMLNEAYNIVVEYNKEQRK